MLATLVAASMVVLATCMDPYDYFVDPVEVKQGDTYTYWHYELPAQEYLPFHERDYEAVRRCIIEEVLPLPRDGGDQAPHYVRFGFHLGAQYNKDLGVGGISQGPPRYTRGWVTRNSYTVEAWQLLQGCRSKFPWISYSDLWTLAAAAAVEYAKGPKIAWKPGRVDIWEDLPIAMNEFKEVMGGPGASGTPWELLFDFWQDQIGFTLQEGVAIMAGHCLGFAHGEQSGEPYEGQWTDEPFTFTNKFFKYLVDYKWIEDDRNDLGGVQYTNLPGKEYMMLPVDMMIHVHEAVPYLVKYANDQEKLFEDFALVYNKCLELNVLWEEEALLARGEIVASK